MVLGSVRICFFSISLPRAGNHAPARGFLSIWRRAAHWLWNQLTNGPVELRAIEAESSRRGFGLQATFPRFRREWLTACSKSPALCTATGPASTGTPPEPPLREQRDVASTAHPVTLCSSPKGVEGMCCNFQKSARERRVGSTRVPLMRPPRTAC